MLILKASLFGLLFFVQASYGSYLVCGPDASAGSRPLIVMLHGCDQTAAEFQRSTEICELAKKEQFHVLFPEQSRARNPIGCWNWYDAKKIEEEAQAVTATLQRVFEHKPIDKAKVHVAGISAGGAFAGYLASCHSDVFKAGAIHSSPSFLRARDLNQALRLMKSGRGKVQKERLCAGFKKAPLLVIHGAKDNVVDVKNVDLLVEDLLDTRSPKPRVVPELPHAWLGGVPMKYSFPNPIKATQLLWDFFSSF